MYEIYINDTPLILCAEKELCGLDASGSDSLLAPYAGKKKFLLNYVDMLEKTDRMQRLVIYSADFDGLKADFHQLFRELSAAGGLVLRPDGCLLAIFRKGHWDLPKGKVEEGESVEQAAVREVEEETGLQDLRLGPLIGLSHHIYREKKKRYLKHTWWYDMRSPDAKLTPQAEEQIEQAVWMKPEDFLQEERRVYASLRPIVRKGLGRMGEMS